MINKLKSIIEQVVVPYFSQEIAELLIANGVAIPTRCEHCIRGSHVDCPEGRVWCEKLCRYMKNEAFCCFGSESSASDASSRQME